MSSVSAVSSIEFRANLSLPQNNAPEGDDPFSLLLNSAADAKAGVQRPEAPQAAERRKDVPAKQRKPEADADRQAKRDAPDAEKPETRPQAGSSAPAKAATADEEVEDSESEGIEDGVAADALVMIALGEPQTDVSVTTVDGDVNVAAQAAAAPVVAANAEAAAEIQTVPAIAAAVAEAAKPAAAEAESAQAAQTAAVAKPQFEIAQVSVQAEAEAEITFPKISADTVTSLLKPLKAAASLDVQAKTQPGSVNVNTATALQGPAHLEMLNAAISKHIQLALGADANEPPQDAPKPMVASNAVAPNFAVAPQISAPLQAPAQQAAEAMRAVPLEQLAVEIATRANKGERRFDIRLDPPELGRIDVRLEIDSKGNTTTKLIVERAETLDLLQRDARSLERALQNAGLKTDAGGPQFSLQQDTQAQQGNQNHAPEMRGRPELVQAEDEIMTEVSVNNASLAAQMRGGVDIRI